MTEPNTPADLEDLSARARRGLLTDAERRLFEQMIASRPDSLLAHQLGCDFDRIGAVRPRDDELIARVVGAVVRAPRQTIVRRSGFRWGFALAATLGVGSAGAALWTARERSSIDVPASTARSVSTTIAPQPLEPRRASAALGDATPPHDAAPPRDVAVSGPAPAAAEKSEKTLEVPEPVSEKTLFRDANLARKAGDLGRARRLYAELERSFPRSEEAKVSRVSAGKLLLSIGSFSEAERQFSLYLARGGGPLAEEASVGRAQSLQALGRAPDEREAWRDLLQRFPASVYAARARSRLAEMEP